MMSCRTTVVALLGLAVLLMVPRPGPACSLCNLNAQQAPTIRQETAQPTARVVVIGTAQDRAGVAAATDLHITQVLRSDPLLGDRKLIELQRYLPSDPKNPPRFLVFCDVFKDKLDPFRGIPL